MSAVWQWVGVGWMLSGCNYSHLQQLGAVDAKQTLESLVTSGYAEIALVPPGR